jgi:putative oxidoreductase
VHPEWSVAEGQFGWLLLIVFGAIALAGPGRYSIDAMLARRRMQG